jgi:hypothetical protein
MAYQSVVGPLLPREGPTYWDGSGFLLDAATEKLAFIFPAPKTGTLHSVGFGLATVTQAPANGLKISFQDVASATGDPDGTIDQYRVVSSGLVTNGWIDVSATGPMTSDGTDGGTKRAVTRGDYLAVVIEFANFSSGDSLSIGTCYSVWYGAPGNHYNDHFTGSWAKHTAYLIKVSLKYDDGTYGYIPSSAPFKKADNVIINSGSNPDEIALKFKMPYPLKVNGLWARLQLDSASADSQLILYDSDGSTVLASAALDATFGPAMDPYFYYVPIPEITLMKDAYYRVAVKPTTTNNLRLIYQEVNDVNIWNQVEQGGNFHWSQRVDAGAWTDTTTKRPTVGVVVSALDDGVGGGGGGLLVHPGMSGGMRG